MQLLTTILTIIGSGIAAAAMTYVLNARREQVFFMRKEAEELYVTFDRYEKLVSTASIRGLMYIQGRYTRSEFMTAFTKEELPEVREAHQNLEMLVYIYYVPCIAGYDDFFKARAALMKLIFSFHELNDPDEEITRKYVTEYDRAMDAYSSATSRLRASIIHQAQTLAGEDALWPAAFRWSVAESTLSGATASVRTRIRNRIARTSSAGGE